MTISLKEMLEIPGSQYVGGNVVIGERTEAKVIASSVDGIFGLTDEGREYFKQAQEAADEAVVTEVVRGTRGRKPKVALDETPVDSVQSTDSAE